MTKKALLTVACGDWIYPSRDSSTSVQYPIDFPLVAEIFLPQKKIGKPVASRGNIGCHLTGPRFLEISVSERDAILRIETLKNREEDDFSRVIGFDIPFKLAELPRVKSIPDGSNSDSTAIFFASVLLLSHLEGPGLPAGIAFRSASVPEVESLGKW